MKFYNTVETFHKRIKRSGCDCIGNKKGDEKALGYSVSTVTNEDLTDALSNNWSNALTGKVAGLNLIKSGGGPDGSNKIILRGENTLSGNICCIDCN